MSKLIEIRETINNHVRQSNRLNPIQLLAVTKQQSINKITELLLQGHRLFGENIVQEAILKWRDLKTDYPDIELHLIGHLQTNKVKEAVALFDVIQTLDSLKLAAKLAKEEMLQNKKLDYLIEINIGSENQKKGILPEDFDFFYHELKKNYPLSVQGIMCIPPIDKNPTPYFNMMKKIADEHQLAIISMGMSNDFKIAIECGANLVRIGRALF